MVQQAVVRQMSLENAVVADRRRRRQLGVALQSAAPVALTALSLIEENIFICERWAVAGHETN